jgi:hypothetical protein
MPIFDVSLKNKPNDTIEADVYEKLPDPDGKSWHYKFYKDEGGKKELVVEYERNVVVSIKKLSKEEEEEYRKLQKEKDFPGTFV